MDVALLRPEQEALREVRAAGVADGRQEPPLLRLPLGAGGLPGALLHRVERFLPVERKKLFTSKDQGGLQKDLVVVGS